MYNAPQSTPLTHISSPGNSPDSQGNASRYDAVLPYFPSDTKKRCVMRLRYNISTDDYDPFNTNSASNEDMWENLFYLAIRKINNLLTLMYNVECCKKVFCSKIIKQNLSILLFQFTRQYSFWTILTHQFLSSQEGVVSPIEQNPLVDVGASARPLRLALNTNQYGRTFQDRSHVFRVRLRFCWFC